MMNETPAHTQNLSPYEERLTALEKHMEILARALAAEKKKTEDLQKAFDTYQRGVAQGVESYDKAFEQAAKSYEPIIQRALVLSGDATIEREPGASQPILVEPAERPPNFSQSLTAIVDDLPRVLASLALVIALITGGSSIASLVKSTSAQDQAVTAVENAGKAILQASNANVEASAANEKAASANSTAETAIQEASSAKVEANVANEKASTAKDTSEVAVKQASEAQVDAATAKEQAEFANQKVDTVIQTTVESGQ